tara:strand:+ start:1387 stop:2250 length:864 start_codon:yes stop_codon:yes gene_type:complete
MKPLHPYAGYTAVLATMHGKEEAIREPFIDGLGLDIVTPNIIDTDVFGTFTGEIRRETGIKDTAIAKARLGMQLTGLPIGIASEGSFGPHPEIPMIPADIELMVLVDSQRDLILSQWLICEETNFAHIEIDTTEDISSFLTQVEFPSHALIVRSNKPVHSKPFVSKGIIDKRSLLGAIKSAAENSFDGNAFVQTDMRAHFNPTRMKVLRQLAVQFVEKLKTLCPSCNSPGFGRVDVERGLPCGVCRTPTRWVKVDIFGCECCGLREARERSDGIRTTGQESCPTCNP